MMLEINDQPAKLTSVNPRAELHGDERKPAVDLAFTFDTGNEILSMFGSQIRGSLFSKARPKDAPPGDQAELDIASNSMPHIRNHCIEGAIRLAFDGVGYQASIGFGIGEASALRLELVRVGKVRVTPKEGGTVTVSIRLQLTDPSEHVIGMLARMIGETVELTISPPSSDQASLE